MELQRSSPMDHKNLRIGQFLKTSSNGNTRSREVDSRAEVNGDTRHREVDSGAKAKWEIQT